MAYLPISKSVPQYSTSSNELADGYYLKGYIAGTTTALSMATDEDAGTLIAKCKIGAKGYPLSDSGDESSIFIPYFNRDYKLVLYKNSTDADADNTGAADWVVDNIKLGTTDTYSALYTVGASNSIVSQVAASAAVVGDIFESNYYDSNLTIGSGAKWKCIALGATPPNGTAGINSDGYLYTAASNAAKFEIVNQQIYLQHFGGREGAADNAAAINAANGYMSSNTVRAFGGATGRNSEGSASKCLVVSGVFNTSVPLTVYPGFYVYSQSGGTLTAISNGQDLLVTAGPTWVASNLNGYDSKNLRIYGGLLLNGNSVAGRGALFDTVAMGSVLQITVDAVNYQKWTTTCTGTSGNNTVVVASASGIDYGDAFEITGEENVFTVVSISGTTVTLSDDLTTSPSGSAMSHVPFGATYLMAQQMTDEVIVKRSTGGKIFSSNLNDFQCTEFTHGGGSNFCEKYGNVLARITGSDGHMRAQRTDAGPEIQIQRGVGNTGYWWVEGREDVHATSVAALQAFPLINVTGGRGIVAHIHWPPNTGTTSWRRLIKNKGDQTRVFIETTVINLLVNPSRAGDYAVIEQNSSSGTSFLEGLIGPSNSELNNPANCIINESGNYMPASRSISSIERNGNLLQAGGYFRRDVASATSSAFESFVRGDNHPSVKVLGRRIYFGDGTAAPSVGFSNISGGVQVAVGHLSVGNGTNVFLRIQATNGVWYYLFVDTSGRLRISSTQPSDRNADGTVVGTQT